MTILRALWTLAILINLPLSNTQSFADPIIRKPIQIDHLNVDYGNKFGKGQVQYMTYHFNTMSLDHKSLNAELEMNGDTLSITDGTTKFSVSKILDFINYFDSIHADDLNFYLENSNFKGSLPKSFLGISGKQFMLEQLALACGTVDRDVADQYDDTLLLIIEMCLGKGSAKFEEMTFPADATTSKILNFALGGALSGGDLQKDSEKIALDKIKNFSLDINDHNFNAHARVKVKLDLGVHSSGRITYEPEQSRYKIELKSMSVGFIPIRWLVYKAIRILNDQSITVEEPNIYIAYQKPFPQAVRKTTKPFK